MRSLLGWALWIALPCPAFAQVQFEELLCKQHLPGDRDETLAVAVGDVDGDGDPDLLFGNGSDQFVGIGLGGQDRLYLNDGAGRFVDATGQLPQTKTDTRAVVLGDVDGDGDQDVAVGLKLYENDGAGHFTDVTSARVSPPPAAVIGSANALVLGDVDGDGDLDLVYGTSIASINRLYLNDGSGSFTDVTATHLPSVRDETTAVALGDVDGDGDPDLVFAVEGQNRVFLNDGGGVFSDATATSLPAERVDSTSVALGDVDGDGDADLVFGSYQAPFSMPYGAQNRMYRNDGTGVFSDATASLPTDFDVTHDVALVDLEGDGDLDLVLANAEELNAQGQNRLYLNDGSGSFTDATASLSPSVRGKSIAVAVADVDGDADPDLVFANTPDYVSQFSYAHWGQNQLWLNDGSGVLLDATAPRLPSDRVQTDVVAMGDVDGDGDVDLVCGNSDFGSPAQNRLYVNDGTASFTDATASSMPQRLEETSALALGDVDGDGDLDVVTGNSGSQNRLYLNGGSGVFTDATAGRMPMQLDVTRAVALADVDGDLDLDIVTGSSDRTRLYLNDGTALFTDASSSLPTRPSDYVVAADVDADGDPDLVLGRGLGTIANTHLWLNDGSGTFTDVTSGRLPYDPERTGALAVGDVDGDADPDIVVGKRAPTNRLFLNDGTGRFTDTTGRIPVSSRETGDLALGDVDLDGDLDLVVANASTWMFPPGGNRLYLNDGTGTFADASQRLPRDLHDTYSLALGDLDRDGDPDLVLGKLGNNFLLVNRHRQLWTPFVPVVTRRYVIELHAAPGYGGVAHGAIAVLGSSVLPAPVTLPPLGELFLGPPVVGLPQVLIGPGGGATSIELRLPAAPALVGVALPVQGLIIDNGRHEIRFTGYAADVIRR